MSQSRPASPTLSPVNNANSPEDFFAHYRRTTDATRRDYKDQLRAIDNDLLIANYAATENNEKSNFIAKLSDKKKSVIFEHYLLELQDSAWRLKEQQHIAADITLEIVKQLSSIQLSSWQKRADTRFADDNFLAVIHATTKFIQTPVLNQDNTPNPTFTQRANELAEVSTGLRRIGRFGVLAGCLDTLLGLACMAGAVVIGLYTFGVIGAASAFTKAIGPLVMGMETAFSFKYGVSAIGKFSTAHKALSLSNKMDALGQAMQQEAAPQVENNNRLTA